MEQEVKIKDLDLDKKSKVKFDIRPEVRIEEVLDLWFGAGVEKQAIDK